MESLIINAQKQTALVITAKALVIQAHKRVALVMRPGSPGNHEQLAMPLHKPP